MPDHIIELDAEQYRWLLFMLGYATSAARREGEDFYEKFIWLANVIKQNTKGQNATDKDSK